MRGGSNTVPDVVGVSKLIGSAHQVAWPRARRALRSDLDLPAIRPLCIRGPQVYLRHPSALVNAKPRAAPGQDGRLSGRMCLMVCKLLGE